MATAAVPVTTAKAGFWIRFVAFLIDIILLAIVGGIIQAIFGITAAGYINFVIGLAYFIYFWSAMGGGQTLGMRAMKVRVVKTDGSELTLVGALLRYIGVVISVIPVFIGLIWAAFDANKQGWHDKIAGTYVVSTK
jgi:uncharacterized RDD family membrane protein YckC